MLFFWSFARIQSAEEEKRSPDCSAMPVVFHKVIELHAKEWVAQEEAGDTLFERQLPALIGLHAALKVQVQEGSGNSNEAFVV